MFIPHTIAHNDNHKLWFVSDTHWAHDRPFILEKRGFKTIEEHDRVLIERWNDKVRPQDTVIHLGDFIVGAGREADLLGEHLLKTLHGTKILLFGNHNAYVKTLFKRLVKEQYDKENTEVYPIETSEFGSKVIFMGNNLLLKVRSSIGTKFVFCSHFAHRIWIDGNKGVWALSGHSHGSDPESQKDFPGVKRLDCGIENFGGPISFDEVAAIMNKKQIQQLDHHDANISPSF
jgi:calcineurin-like phosphoesterase family protein